MSRPFWIVGALPPPGGEPVPAGAETFTLGDMKQALSRVTPTLLFVGIATGAAFAIGGGLVSRFVFRDKR